MTLAFRNIDVTPDDPVERWGVEGLIAAVDRGSIIEWERIAAAIRTDPWGPVALDLVEALHAAEDTGVAGALRAALTRARTATEQADRAEVAASVRDLISRSGLSRREFAARIGTSASRLSTYANGRVVPSAALMRRMQRLADQT